MSRTTARYEEPEPKQYFYCARRSRRGDILTKQNDVHRITQTMCLARCAGGRCPKNFQIAENCKIYREECL